jgi:formyltetrahydrofolate-dependent phosphoribosylglycinamide formyltransferase
VTPEAEPARPGVFLDRDGTVIEDAGYLRDPAQVHLLPGAAAAIRRLNLSGLPALLVTNQSGIARGLLSVDDYRATQARLGQVLATEGARIDGDYFCPHLPEITGPCECRKPGTLLYRQAAERLSLDLGRSWWVGDRIRDLLPSRAFGGRGILVQTGAGKSEAAEAGGQEFMQATDLAEAVELILASSPMKMRVAVAISGRGSNLEALLGALGPSAPAEIVLVVSDRAGAAGLALARAQGIAAEVLADPTDAHEWLRLLGRHRTHLVVLAGYLKLVPAPVIEAYRGRIINVHPALLPAFGGKGMYGHRVHEAVLASGARETGATVHLVDEVYDQGPVLAQARVPVVPGDTAERLAIRVLEAEHRLLPAAVIAAARAGRAVPFELGVGSRLLAPDC